MTDVRQGRDPDFLILGGMKCGSTTLFEYLCRHSRVHMPARKKEPQFFSRDHVYEKGMEWYRSLFREARPDQLCGEASTCYSRNWRYPKAPERIARALPDARFIYIMRHPVDRFYSHYRHVVQERFLIDGSPPITLARFVEEDREGTEARDAGMYLRQIGQYLERYPRSALLLLTMDDLSRDPAAVMDEVQDFLGLPREGVTEGATLLANRAGDVLVREQVAGRLRGIRRLPVIRWVADLAGASARRGISRFLAGRLEGGRTGRRLRSDFMERVSPLDDATRSMLLETYAEPDRELEEFLGRELPDWRT